MSAFRGQYIGFKYLKTQDEYVLSIHIPKHEWATVYRLIGDPPNAGESKWLGLARIEDDEAPTA